MELAIESSQKASKAIHAALKQGYDQNMNVIMHTLESYWAASDNCFGEGFPFGKVWVLSTNVRIVVYPCHSINGRE